MFIAASSKNKDDGVDGEGREHRHESFEWNVTVGTEGFVLENEYSLMSKWHGKGGKGNGKGKGKGKDYNMASMSFRHTLVELKEFVKTDPNSTTETYTDQEVVVSYPLTDWSAATYEGECTIETSCVATFTSADECVKVVVRANLGGESPDNRLKLSADDLKMDYIITDACPLNSTDNAYALIGTVETSQESRVRQHKHKGKGKGKPVDVEGVDDPGHKEDSGVTMEADEGVQAYFSWLDEVDCGSEKVSRPVATATETEPVVVTDVKGKGKGKHGYKNRVQMRWAIHTQPTDGECVWDPLYGVFAPENAASENAASTRGLGAGIVASAVLLVSLF